MNCRWKEIFKLFAVTKRPSVQDNLHRQHKVFTSSDSRTVFGCDFDIKRLTNIKVGSELLVLRTCWSCCCRCIKYFLWCTLPPCGWRGILSPATVRLWTGSVKEVPIFYLNVYIYCTVHGILLCTLLVIIIWTTLFADLKNDLFYFVDYIFL